MKNLLIVLFLFIFSNCIAQQDIAKQKVIQKIKSNSYYPESIKILKCDIVTSKIISPNILSYNERLQNSIQDSIKNEFGIKKRIVDSSFNIISIENKIESNIHLINLLAFDSSEQCNKIRQKYDIMSKIDSVYASNEIKMINIINEECSLRRNILVQVLKYYDIEFYIEVNPNVEHYIVFYFYQNNIKITNFTKDKLYYQLKNVFISFKNELSYFYARQISYDIKSQTSIINRIIQKTEFEIAKIKKDIVKLELEYNDIKNKNTIVSDSLYNEITNKWQNKINKKLKKEIEITEFLIHIVYESKNPNGAGEIKNWLHDEIYIYNKEEGVKNN